MTEFIERREFFRMQIDCEIHCENKENGDYIYMGRCTTLSGAGISFITLKKLKVNDRLNVTINPQQALTSAIEAKISVMRITPLEDNAFEIGATLEILKH